MIMSKMILSNNSNPYVISDRLLDFIKDFEGLRDGCKIEKGFQPYLCPAGVWTCGYGRVCRHGNKVLTQFNCKKDSLLLNKFDFVNESVAIGWLRDDINIFVKGVASRLTVDILEHQFEMLVSHAFNCGYSQTLYMLVNSGQSKAIISDWIKNHYVTARGVRMSGLVRRRLAEAAIFFNGW
jgi:lysozyme